MFDFFSSLYLLSQTTLLSFFICSPNIKMTLLSVIFTIFQLRLANVTLLLILSPRNTNSLFNSYNPPSLVAILSFCFCLVFLKRKEKL